MLYCLSDLCPYVPASLRPCRGQGVTPLVLGSWGLIRRRGGADVNTTCLCEGIVFRGAEAAVGGGQIKADICFLCMSCSAKTQQFRMNVKQLSWLRPHTPPLPGKHSSFSLVPVFVQVTFFSTDRSPPPLPPLLLPVQPEQLINWKDKVLP